MHEQITADMDGGWKQLMEEYLEEFFRFFFPKIHAGIDFGQGYQYLDKELAQIMAGPKSGRREVDKLIQVRWKDGGTDWILVHIEVQAQRESDFAKRMCVYNCRIWDRYNEPVVSLALLADGDPRFRPDRFQRQMAGCRLEFTFPIVKLLDFKSEQELALDPSPFAIASLIQLRKLQAGPDVQRRYTYKLALAHALYRRGYERNDVLKLFRFMDFVLTLPEAFSLRFRDELEVIEKELNMPYVTSVERLARQEGRQEGIEKGILQCAVDLLRQALEVRFGEVPASLLEKIQQCQDVDVLRACTSRYSRSARWTNCNSDRLRIAGSPQACGVLVY